MLECESVATDVERHDSDPLRREEEGVFRPLPEGEGRGEGRGEPASPTTHDWRLFITALVASDALAVVAAALAGGYVRYEQPTLPQTYPALWGQLGLLLLYLGIFWTIGWRVGIYSRDNLLGGPTEYERVFHTTAYSGFALMLVAYLFGLPALSRAWWVILLVAGALDACLLRFGLRRVAYWLRRRGLFVTRMLIVGANDQGIDIGRQLMSSANSGFRVLGFLDDYLPVGTRVSVATAQRNGAGQENGSAQIDLEVLGGTRKLHETASELRIQEVVVVPEALPWESLRNLIDVQSAGTAGLKVHLAAGLYNMVTATMTPTRRSLVPLLTLGTRRLQGTDRFLKRLFDLSFGGLLLATLLLPALVTVAVARMRRVHPLLEWWSVMGQGGRPVRIALLSEAVTGRLPLRGAPALLWVLLGRLSVVGPQPIRQEGLQRYARRGAMMLAVKPGLTGYWRMLPESATQEEVAAWDLWYLRNYSIWNDLFLMFQTTRLAMRKVGLSRSTIVSCWEADEEADVSRDGVRRMV